MALATPDFSFQNSESLMMTLKMTLSLSLSQNPKTRQKNSNRRIQPATQESHCFAFPLIELLLSGYEIILMQL